MTRGFLTLTAAAGLETPVSSRNQVKSLIDLRSDWHFHFHLSSVDIQEDKGCRNPNLGFDGRGSWFDVGNIFDFASGCLSV